MVLRRTPEMAGDSAKSVEAMSELLAGLAREIAAVRALPPAEPR